MNSTKNICNESDKMKTPSNLQDLLAGVEKDIKEINKNIESLDKLNLTQDNFFI